MKLLPLCLGAVAVLAALATTVVSISHEDSLSLEGSVRGYGYGRYGHGRYYRRCRGPTLFCRLKPTTSKDLEGNVGKVHGYLYFQPQRYRGKCMTRISGKVRGLGDKTPHGWHIHEFGDISAPDGTATGSHYNPQNVPHGLPGSKGSRHAGDLGNLYPNRRGIAWVRHFASVKTREIENRALIIHAKEDDGGQPTGNAGARLAQCKIVRSRRRQRRRY